MTNVDYAILSLAVSVLATLIIAVKAYNKR